jgi:curved DNA-binding protein CbpA
VDAGASEEARARSVLGVGANASKGDIERAYRGQMKRAHPDRGGSVERAAALNAARDVLLRRG